MADVRYRLEIDGTPASAEVMAAIQQIDVEDHAEKADVMRLRFATAVQSNGESWTLLDEGLFPRLTRLRLTVTIGSRSAIHLIEAYVIETAVSFSNHPGGSTFTVVAMDPTVLMHLDERVKPWVNMRDSDVAAAVFSDRAYGFTPVVDDTRHSRAEDDQTLVQRGSDIQFLRMLADRNGFECFVEIEPSNGTVEGHFHAPRLDQAAQGVLTLNMGAATNVNRFEVRQDHLAPLAADASSVEAGSGSAIDAQTDRTSDAELGASPSTSSDRPRRVLLSRVALGQADEVQAYAKSVTDRSSWSIVARGELNTVAYGGVLRAKRPVSVRGLGRSLSGTYYVESVLHTFAGASYVQRFVLRRNAVGLKGDERFVEDEALSR